MPFSPQLNDISDLGQTNNFISPNKSRKIPDYFITRSTQLRSYEQQELCNLPVIEQLKTFPTNGSDVHVMLPELGPELLR